MSKVSLLIGIVIGVALLGVVMSMVTGTNTAAEVACNSELGGDGWDVENVTANEENKSMQVTCVKNNDSEDIRVMAPGWRWEV